MIKKIIIFIMGVVAIKKAIFKYKLKKLKKQIKEDNK